MSVDYATMRRSVDQDYDSRSKIHYYSRFVRSPVVVLVAVPVQYYEYAYRYKYVGTINSPRDICYLARVHTMHNVYLVQRHVVS